MYVCMYMKVPLMWRSSETYMVKWYWELCWP